MSELGTDISCLSDIGAKFRFASGFENLGQAIARRLQTPRGGLFYDLDYGTDLRDWLNAVYTEADRAEFASAIAAECEKDPRVLSADAEIVRTGQDVVNVTVSLETLEGPFSMVLGVDQVTVEVLYADLG